MKGRVLILAGSDSGGGAGVQADLKAVTQLGGHGFCALTALTVQNSLGVLDVHPVPLGFIAAQARAVLDDLGADIIKTGMLGDVATAELCAEIIADSHLPAVIDPVMVAKGGAPLLDPSAIASVRDLLIPKATLLTPNAPEASVLTGLAIETLDDQRRAGEALLRLGAQAVLMKGGHLPGEALVDLLMTHKGETRFEGRRIATRHTHGTGCTLASAIAAGLAQGQGLTDAVARARRYLDAALHAAPGFGQGHGPLYHGVRPPNEQGW